MHFRTQKGKAAEEAVAQKLKNDGFTILEKNYQKRDGEIDLIAKAKGLLVFVEVKMRQERYFDIGSVITPAKQRKIIHVAKQYIALHAPEQCSYRFDVALLYTEGSQYTLTYIANAFNEGDCTW